MTTYAEINNENIVVNCIIADAEFIATQTDKTYIQYGENNLAGIGYKYLSDVNKFIEPQPFESWKLNSSYKWEAPKPHPNDGSAYYWDEDSQEWIKENEL